MRPRDHWFFSQSTDPLKRTHLDLSFPASKRNGRASRHIEAVGDFDWWRCTLGISRRFDGVTYLVEGVGERLAFGAEFARRFAVTFSSSLQPIRRLLLHE